MKEKIFVATLSQSQGRAGWCVIFRHPLKTTKTGEKGARIRRGLGTSNREEAQEFVDELNTILADSSYWSIAERARAERTFNPRIVSAFYDDLDAEPRDYWSTRSRFIDLPEPSEGYARLLILGTTGAGKTTVVRQLMGTDPKKERFPSTSTSKTTISNLEVVLGKTNSYRAIVTFFPKDYIRQLIDECVSAAITSYIERGDENEIEAKLSEHNDQRFRLKYLIGTSKPTQRSDDFEDDIDSDDTPEYDLDELDAEERDKLIERLTDFVQQIKQIAANAREDVQAQLNFSFDDANERDRAAFEEILEDDLFQRDDFQEIIDEILDEVESKFEYLTRGTLHRDRAGWPNYWSFESTDRAEFIRTVNQFSSNYAPKFGRLLTPIVEGIRVAGDFYPTWMNAGSRPRLVLMDGEGLGHTPDTTSSISTSVTNRYKDVDAIVLVDNAMQPMQAAPTALLRSLITSGYDSKLVIIFTHFDQVKGDNLPTRSLKREHVLNSFDNTVTGIASVLGGQRVKNSFALCRSERTFFVGSIQDLLDPISKSNNLTIAEFSRMFGVVEKLIEPPIPTNVYPIYYDADLLLRIQSAMFEFREPWNARLGYESLSAVRKEHWATIKALTRRLGEMGQDEYKELRPVADLIARISEQVSQFLNNPNRFEPNNAPQEMKDAAIRVIEQEFFQRLSNFARERLWLQRSIDWSHAYAHRGTGSTYERAKDVKLIYDSASPVIIAPTNEFARDFLADIRKLVKESVMAGNGNIESA